MKEHERKLEQAEKLVDFCRTSSDVDTSMYAKILEYRSNLSALGRIYKNFTNEDGVFDIWTSGTDRDKQTLNSYSMEIAAFEKWFVETPIYNELRKKFAEEQELPQFLKDDATVTGKATELMSSGWYQNSIGDLYHYDGVVWDNVPGEKIENLEFLGG